MRHWRTTLAVIATVALVGTACGAGQQTGGGGTSAPEEKPVAGGRVIYGDAADIQRLNPATSNDATSSRVSAKIYDSLIIPDYKTGEIKPWLGSWTVSSDGLTYTWTIDAKANWSDGKPIIGNDFLTRVKMQGRSKVTKNENYWKGAPYLDEWVQKVVADSTVLAAQLKTGELTAGLVQPSDVADLSKADNLKLYKWANNGYTYIGWRTNNSNVAFLGDKRIRQALMYGINTEEIVKAVYFGEGTKQLAHHPPAAWASAPSNTLNAYAYD